MATRGEKGGGKCAASSTPEAGIGGAGDGNCAASSTRGAESGESGGGASSSSAMWNSRWQYGPPGAWKFDSPAETPGSAGWIQWVDSKWEEWTEESFGALGDGERYEGVFEELWLENYKWWRSVEGEECKARQRAVDINEKREEVRQRHVESISSSWRAVEDDRYMRYLADVAWEHIPWCFEVTTELWNGLGHEYDDSTKPHCRCQICNHHYTSPSDVVKHLWSDEHNHLCEKGEHYYQEFAFCNLVEQREEITAEKLQAELGEYRRTGELSADEGCSIQ